MKLKASKCGYMMSQVTYLGQIVSQEGIQTDPENTSAIWDRPVPQNIKDVRSFLGFTGHYRRFIQNFARIARPLNNLLIGHGTFKKIKGKKRPNIKKVSFIWEDAQQKAFDTLKEKFTNPSILAYADYHLPFKLHTDASSTGLGQFYINIRMAKTELFAMQVQLLSKIFKQSDFCHNYLHTLYLFACLL